MSRNQRHRGPSDTKASRKKSQKLKGKSRNARPRSHSISAVSVPSPLSGEDLGKNNTTGKAGEVVLNPNANALLQPVKRKSMTPRSSEDASTESPRRKNSIWSPRNSARGRKPHSAPISTVSESEGEFASDLVEAYSEQEVSNLGSSLGGVASITVTAAAEETLFRTKVMFLGKPAAGKTSLALAVRGVVSQRKNSDLVQLSTDGIEISHTMIGDLDAAIWDFAGQDVYFITHSLFISDDSVFVLCFTLEESVETSNLCYWLSALKASAPNNPVIIVGTHHDCVPTETITVAKERIKRLMSRYPDIVGLTTIGLDQFGSFENLSLLKEVIVAAARESVVSSQLIDLEQMVLEERRSRTVNLCTRADFTNFSARCGIIGDANVMDAITHLVNRGLIMFFPFKQYCMTQEIVLDPQWLSDMLSSVFTTKHHWVKEGRLKTKDFPHIWEAPVEICSLLVSVMTGLELVTELPRQTGFRVRDRTLLIPSLLPSASFPWLWDAFNEVLECKDSEMPLKRVYEFDTPIVGVFSRLILRFLKFSKPVKLFKNQAYFKKDNTLMECSETTFRGTSKLRFQTRGPLSREFLRFARDNLESLIDSVRGGEINELIPYTCYQCEDKSYQSSLVDVEMLVAAGKSMFDCPEGHPIRLDVAAPSIANVAGVEIDFGDLTDAVQLDSGAFGTVFKAMYRGTPVAYKQLDASGQADSEAFHEFRNEALLFSQLRHPAIIGYLGATMSPFCLVLELAKHGHLMGHIKKMDRPNMSFASKVALNVAAGLKYLHSISPPIAHRDVKSPNILLVDVDPNVPVIAKLADFGEAKTSVAATGRGALFNPRWLAPEILCEKPATTAADVYSLAMVMWEMVALQLPFDATEEGQSPFNSVLEEAIIKGLRPQMPKACPSWYESLITVCWSEDPLDRLSAGDLFNFLKEQRKMMSFEKML